ncbi:hypothetical protein [Novosphingobium sp.]|uniref:hypothetical protein n=1 Tax=Novosphingobium sp. TaxID=1874826 RepID=UPI0035B04FAD
MLPMLLLGTPALAAPPPAPVATVAKDQAAHKAACDELAAAVVTGDDIEFQVDTMISALLQAMQKGNPDLAQLEAAFPGLIDAIGAALKPVMVRHMQSILPSYRADLSALYQENLTTEDALEAAAFFRRPEVRAFVSSINRSTDYKAISQDAVSTEQVSDRAVKTDLSNAGVRAARDLSPEQRKPIMDFFVSPLGVKILALGPKKTAIDARWSNYSTPAFEADMMQATGRAMVDHIAKTNPAAAKAIEAEFIRSGMIEP